MKFKKIAAVDYVGIDQFVHDELAALCDELVMHGDFPETDDEVVRRAEGADALLVSWNTRITANVINRLPDLRYIGMCCSLYSEASANVDIACARSRGISVKGVRDYGDNGVVEFIFSELIRLAEGFGTRQLRKEPIELTGLTLGIVGLGAVGKMVADTGKVFGMNICYHNRSPRADADYPYLPLEELLARCDVVSTHLPRNTVVLGEKELQAFGAGKILVNSGLSPSYDERAFDAFITRAGNYAILDASCVTAAMREVYRKHSNIVMSNRNSGFTLNARKRLAQKALLNLNDFLNNN